ncbi:hypothetical protein [Myceligenerans salitolerans]|uniref:Uncharacterized protein n=1 Tax=Myceligenerans salitolerans TaxID=1230528 RepID=A0ABS3ICZ5_9MICO|nr:hypothetical protein [Myceligenerans salitolerans]MBO0610259.1 hypothetical protein [Myceligenerans salitolerans]
MAPLDDSPRHATARPQRMSWDPRPLLADLKAGVQAQLARTETPGAELAGEATVSQPTVDAGMSDPAGSDDARVGGSAMVHAPTSAESKDRKHLRRAAEAAEAAAAHAAGAASQAAITAERARSDARVAREEAAAAHAAAGSVVAELSAAREEVTVLHQALEHVRSRARRDVLIAWVAAAIALAVATAGLLTG